MGCDIHIYTEWRKHGGEWQSADTPETKEEGTEDEYISVSHFTDCSRSYGLFALIAEVRGEFSVSLKCKEIWPDDATAVSIEQTNRWDADGHSHSWLTLREIKEHLIRISLSGNDVPQWAVDDYVEIKDHISTLESTEVSDEDIRILFLFDN